MASASSIRFQFDPALEILTAEPHWTIATEEDCRAWFDEYARYFKKLNRGKVDIVFVLGNFRVEANIARVWGGYRARLVREYARYSVRVDASVRLSTATHTSGILHGVTSEEASTVAEAVRLILEKRKANAAPSRCT